MKLAGLKGKKFSKPDFFQENSHFGVNAQK